MTKKNEEILSAFDGRFDEGLKLLLEDTQRRAEESHLSPAERKKLKEMRQKEAERKRKEAEKAKARAKNRVTTYLPTSLIEAIERIAETESVSMAQVITFFLFEALERYEQKEIGFWGYKHPSESPRYEWILVHPKDTERTEKIESRKFKK